MTKQKINEIIKFYMANDATLDELSARFGRSTAAISRIIDVYFMKEKLKKDIENLQVEINEKTEQRNQLWEVYKSMEITTTYEPKRKNNRRVKVDSA